MHEFFAELAAFLDSGRWLKLLLLVIGIMTIWIMVKVQHGNNRVDFKDLLIEDGKAAPTKLFQLGCFISSTWVFIVLANNNQLQEWFFNGYIFLWSGTRLVTKWIDRAPGRVTPPAPTNINVTADPGQPVNVQAGPQPPT